MTDIKPPETEVSTAQKPEIDRGAIKEMVSKWTPEERRAILKAFNRLPGQEPKIDVQEQADTVARSALNEGVQPVDTTIQGITGIQTYSGNRKPAATIEPTQERQAITRPAIPRPDPGAIPIRRMLPIQDPNAVKVVEYEAHIPKLPTPFEEDLRRKNPQERRELYRDGKRLAALSNTINGDFVVDSEGTIFRVSRPDLNRGVMVNLTIVGGEFNGREKIGSVRDRGYRLIEPSK